MEYHLLGERTGLRVSPVALGTGRLGTGTGAAPDEPRKVLEAFAAAGGNFIDTSSAYQLGRAEEFTGEFLASAGRDAFVVSSKYGRTPAPTPVVAAVGSHRKAMRAEVEGSLRRLRTDRLDIYFVHFDDGVTPVDEIMRGFEDLVRDGKVIYPALSNFPAWRIATAATRAELRGWAGPAVLQLQYNLLERTADREHLPLARARGLGVMAWSPLAGGLLTGKERLQKAGRDPESSEGMVTIDERAEGIVSAVCDVARELACEPASVALAWVAVKGLTPVIGPRTIGQLAASLAALSVRLSEGQVKKLDEASGRPLGYFGLLMQEQARIGITASTR